MFRDEKHESKTPLTNGRRQHQILSVRPSPSPSLARRDASHHLCYARGYDHHALDLEVAHHPGPCPSRGGGTNQGTVADRCACVLHGPGERYNKGSISTWGRLWGEETYVCCVGLRPKGDCI